MGRIVAPFGVKGWAKIQPFTSEPGALADFPSWWLHLPSGWKEAAVDEAKVHGQTVVARLEGFDTPEQVARLGKVDVAVPRDSLPPAEAGEYYWADLIGMDVVNGAGERLGVVESLLDNGAQSVLVVRGDRERLIPFVEQFVTRVDPEGRRIEVDWGADY